MAYLAREDGVRFVIPSYRDAIDGRSAGVLKLQVMEFSQRYGGYIALQKKNDTEYELACSPESGYLFGESVWQALKKPEYLIYCEADPNGTDAFLVIVKSGSVYLDGRFAIDDLESELVLLQTEQVKFDIVVYGDVPISKEAKDGFVSFQEAQVASFQVLSESLFKTLPLYKQYQLQLVEPVLKAHGIGVVPLKPFIIFASVLAIVWGGWMYFSQEPPPPPPPVNIYQGYIDALHSPSMLSVIEATQSQTQLLSTMPGWSVQSMNYTSGGLKIKVTSYGGSLNDLIQWAQKNNLNLTIGTKDIGFDLRLDLKKRPDYLKIHPINDVIAKVVDAFGLISERNLVQLSEPMRMGTYTQMKATVQLSDANQAVLLFIAKTLQQLPLDVTSIEWKLQTNGTSFSFVMQFNILGS